MDKLNELLSKRASMDIVEDNELSYSDIFYNKELCAGFASYLESIKLVDALLIAFEIGKSNFLINTGNLVLKSTNCRNLPPRN
jgi:hypothetical protein